jgi:hypothetical protein
MDTLEQMRGRDVGEVERRVLPHQDDVECRQRHAPVVAESEMVAHDVADGERLHAGEHLALQHRHPVGRVIAERVSAGLRLQQQRKGRIAADIDPLDRVHLNRDVQRHG